jgi:hypothetical protein
LRPGARRADDRDLLSCRMIGFTAGKNSRIIAITMIGPA